MYKYFTAKTTLTYIDVLPQLVKSYNNTYHRSINMKSSQVTKANEAKVGTHCMVVMYKSEITLNFKYATAQGSVRLSDSLKSLTFPISRKKCLLCTNDLRVKYRSIN